MKKTIIIFLLGISFISFMQKNNKIEIIQENGVEIVVNHEIPYKITGAKTSFKISEELILDLESEHLADQGISEIRALDINRKGNIIFACSDNIFIFDKTGNLVQKFGNVGQGPGEFQIIGTMRIVDSGDISVFDPGNLKFLIYSSNGQFKSEIKMKPGILSFQGIYLENENFLLRERTDIPEKGLRTFNFSLRDKSFEKITDLEPKYTIEHIQRANKFNLVGFSMRYEISKNRIYLASNMAEHLNIHIYDFEGHLKKKIQRIANKVKVSSRFKQETLLRWKQAKAWQMFKLENKYYFCDNFPPFKLFWVDEQGRIFVETYKRGNTDDECQILIFDYDGIFVGEAWVPEAKLKIFRNDRLYCLYEKESGFQKMVVYKLIWH